MSAIEPGYSNEATRNRREIKKNADAMYESSFGDLPDGTIYRDPCGWKTDGESVELQKSRWKQLNEEAAFPDGSSVIEKWNELQRKGYSIEDTTREIRKSLDTGDWTLPIDIIPEVFNVNPEQLPMADMISRVTTQNDEVNATPLQAYPDVHWGLEDTAPTDADGNRVYQFEDPTYGDLTYPVQGFGAATRISDKMILSSSNLRNAESTQEQAFVRAMRMEEERQIILGTNNDPNGFDGLDDFIATGDGEVIGDIGDPDTADPSDYEAATRQMIDDAEYEGASRDSLAVVVDFDWHNNLRQSLIDNVRYDPDTELAGGFTTLSFDDVPILKSHAITRVDDVGAGTTNTQAYTVNMEALYLATLQEVNVRPLARLGPQERLAVDSYSTLVAEDNGAHVRGYSVTTPA